MKCELNIGGVGVADGIYKITARDGLDFAIALGDKAENWSNDNLGYAPKLVIHAYDGIHSPFLVFDNEQDKMLFKLNFAHLWQY